MRIAILTAFSSDVFYVEYRVFSYCFRFSDNAKNK